MRTCGSGDRLEDFRKDIQKITATYLAYTNLLKMPDRSGDKDLLIANRVDANEAY